MNTKLCSFFAVLISTLLIVSTVLAKGHAETLQPKNAVLLVAFGTTVPQALKAFDQIEKQVRQTFPQDEVRWAFTSKFIRKKLRKQGKHLEPPVVALAELLDDGYTNIVIASFQTLPGEEFHDLYQDVQAMKQTVDTRGVRLLVSWPLLSSRENMVAVTKALLKQVPKERQPGDAVVLMGHGSEHHPGDAVFAAMNYYSTTIDPNLFIGTVEGNPTLDDIIPKLEEKGIKKVYLMPFMAVAGDHARNDMCGKEADSWKSMLQDRGFEVTCVMKGTAENPAIVEVWLDNIRKAHSHFEQ